MRKIAYKMIAAVGGMLMASAAFGQVIRLESHAVVAPHEDVRLGNIATITGVDARTAAALANTVVLSDVSSARKIRAESVLMAVISQVGAGGVADRLQLSGAATVDVTVGEGAKAFQTTEFGEQNGVAAGVPAGPAKQDVPVVTASVASPAVAVKAPGKGAVLSQMIMDRVQKDLGVGADDFRVRFDTTNPLLDQPTPAGAKWQFRALTRGMLGTVPFEAELVSGPRILQRLMVQTRVEQRSMVLCAAGELPSGTVMTKDKIRVQETWLDREMPTLFTKDTESQLIGLQAQREIIAGSMLDQRDFKPVVMAERGDVVTVIFMVGSLKVQMSGRAMGTGKLHDQIPVRNEATGQEYQATLIGKCLAVVGGTLTEAQEKQLRESR